MCLSPISIPNPYHGTQTGVTNDIHYAGALHSLDPFLQVPCGRCPVCIALKQSSIVQRVQMESLDNLIYFGTLTYNRESLSSIDVNGYNISYAPIEDFTNMIRYVRKWNNVPPFRYLAVSEFGGKKHRPHWHFLIFIPKTVISDNYDMISPGDAYHYQSYLWPIFLDKWRHNIGSRKHPIWKQNCTYKQVGNKRNYDFQFVDTLSGLSDDVSFYVTKYVCKYDDYTDRLKSALYFNVEPEKFKDLWNLVRPHSLYSKGVGNPSSPLVQAHIQKGIDLALKTTSHFPFYINPNDGSTFPLSPYYCNKLMPDAAQIEFYERSRLCDKENPTFQEVQQRLVKWSKTIQMIRARDTVDFSDYYENNLREFTKNPVISYGMEFDFTEDQESAFDW